MVAVHLVLRLKHSPLSSQIRNDDYLETSYCYSAVLTDPYSYPNLNIHTTYSPTNLSHYCNFFYLSPCWMKINYRYLYKKVELYVFVQRKNLNHNSIIDNYEHSTNYWYIFKTWIMIEGGGTSRFTINSINQNKST